MKTVFLRVLEARDKGSALRESVSRTGASPSLMHTADPSTFRLVPKSPFAYWVSDAVRAKFNELQTLGGNGRSLERALSTNDDFRYIRLWWERLADVADSRPASGWLPFAKGGSYSPYYADVHLLVNWRDEGAEIEADALRKYPYLNGNAEWVLHREAHYLHPGLTWTLRTTSELSMRVLPRGCIFSHKGPALFVPDDQEEELLRLLAITNSRPFQQLTNLQLAAADAAARSYEAGVLAATPVPDISKKAGNHLEGCARRLFSLARARDLRSESSHAFVLPALLQVHGATLAESAHANATRTASIRAMQVNLQEEINAACLEVYGLNARDFTDQSDSVTDGKSDSGDEEDDADEVEVDTAPMVVSLLSWSLGVAFGRFDVRLATGARSLPPEPDPFHRLPVCSPGILTGDDGLPVDAPPPGYPLAFPAHGILVDDPGHPHDLVKAVRIVFHEVFDDANARWHEAAELVGARGGDLRDWFARTFFAEHIKRYSKSRRKAPIYWQLATASGSYSVWVYIHRATPDTLFRVLNDFVGPKLDHEREKLDQMARDVGPNPSRANRDALAAQEVFVDELQALRAEVVRVAPLWRPHLDDGVILNFAPLWRLVPHERNWQMECRKAWDKLCAAEYDWAHVAMHLWPERVLLKCIEDRSVAIAHGIENVFWRQDASGSWHAVDVSESRVRKLVAERTSQAVKAALKDLLSAATPTPSKGRKAKGRSTSPRSAAPKSAPAAARATAAAATPTHSIDEVTLSAVKTAIASIADGASKADVLAATGLSDADCNKAIAALLDRGDITRTGQRRGTRYHVDSQGEDG